MALPTFIFQTVPSDLGIVAACLSFWGIFSNHTLSYLNDNVFPSSFERHSDIII